MYSRFAENWYLPFVVSSLHQGLCCSESENVVMISLQIHSSAASARTAARWYNLLLMAAAFCPEKRTKCVSVSWRGSSSQPQTGGETLTNERPQVEVENNRRRLPAPFGNYGESS